MSSTESTNMLPKIVGRRLPDDPLFKEGDSVCNMYKRLGVFDVDSEELCHKEIKNLVCEIPGCSMKLNSVMELELHYNSLHRYTCATCRKSFASAHLLDLHIEETHDSYFAVQAERKPMYRCLVEKCSTRFVSSQERHDHCVENHAFPPNFRWVTLKVSKPKSSKSKAQKPRNEDNVVKENLGDDESSMAMDVEGCQEAKTKVANTKPIQGFVFGRGNMKKSFSSKSSNWHERGRKAPKAPGTSALDSSQLSKDLMDCLPDSDMK